ncbi:hypothetical protein TKK_0007783 [Trichogramma kaykai]|uniref:Nuclear inhibitor of protein phosphatase 1 n=1 Tax=Trichogramma kaykai TaxID=54128 RepID=A0ABD2X6K3_9HYME
MANHYEVPNWAGKPAAGLHLDVLKGDKLIQKLMVDEKKCYLFGRNQQLNDFSIDHASCSRVHAALVYHKHLKRTFLVDLGSTHGTYIGSIRLEAHKPTQLPINSTFHFGASTRYYTIRERPQTGVRAIIDEVDKGIDEQEGGGVHGLPDTELELDNLTEFNTAHNRRISMLGISDEDIHKITRKRKKKNITFNDDEEVINPEDIDPTIGRFRNLIQSTVVPSKKSRIDTSMLALHGKRNQSLKRNHIVSHESTLYEDIPQIQGSAVTTQNNQFQLIGIPSSSRLGIGTPNPAPDVDIPSFQEPNEPSLFMDNSETLEHPSSEPKKKKYAKEAWPGKKFMPTFLI